MGTYREIKPEELTFNPFEAIGKDWMLVTAAKQGVVNMLTASWGGFGIIWGKAVAYIFIRPQRYTREFIDAAETLSLTFYDEAYREKLTYAGTHSGREEDKVVRCGFHTAFDERTPYFEEAHTVILCRQLYRQPMGPAFFLADGLDETIYPERDHHIMYICEVEKVLQAKELGGFTPSLRG